MQGNNALFLCIEFFSSLMFFIYCCTFVVQTKKLLTYLLVKQITSLFPRFLHPVQKIIHQGIGEQTFDGNCIEINLHFTILFAFTFSPYVHTRENIGKNFFCYDLVLHIKISKLNIRLLKHNPEITIRPLLEICNEMQLSLKKVSFL